MEWSVARCKSQSTCFASEKVSCTVNSRGGTVAVHLSSGVEWHAAVITAHCSLLSRSGVKDEVSIIPPSEKVCAYFYFYILEI